MNDRLIEKVSKLMTTAADSGATEAEAATALRLANRLMDAHRITPEDIERFASKGAVKSPEDRAADFTTMTLLRSTGVRTTSPQSWIAMAAAAVTGCRTYRSWDYETGRYRQVIVGYGREADLRVAKALAEQLHATMLREVEGYKRTLEPRQNVRRETNAFRAGFATGLLHKARDAKKAADREEHMIEAEAPAAGGERALVTIDVREERAQHERALMVKQRQLGIGRGRATSYGTGSYSGRQAGRDAAARTSLSTRGLS